MFLKRVEFALQRLSEKIELKFFDLKAEEISENSLFGTETKPLKKSDPKLIKIPPDPKKEVCSFAEK